MKETVIRLLITNKEIYMENYLQQCQQDSSTQICTLLEEFE